MLTATLRPPPPPLAAEALPMKPDAARLSAEGGTPPGIASHTCMHSYVECRKFERFKTVWIAKGTSGLRKGTVSTLPWLCMLHLLV